MIKSQGYNVVYYVVCIVEKIVLADAWVVDL